jgi:hypothetical protein
MKFFPADWLRDTRPCSLEARGAWIDLCCILWESKTRGQITWPISAFDQFWGTVERDHLIYSASEILEELETLGICDVVTLDNTNVTVTCRRMYREEVQRNQTRERVKRHRTKSSNANVRGRYQKSEVIYQISDKEKKKIIHPISIPKWGDPEYLIGKYNTETPDQLPAVEKSTPARLTKARAYLKIFPEESFWTEAFSEIGKSPFLQGLQNSNGHGNFKANFDWLLTKGKDGTENVVKVFEGRYRNGN